LAPICYPGSPDPRCSPIPPTQTPFVCVCNNSTPKPIPPPICYQGSTDPRCSLQDSVVCYPGSPDPRCPQYPSTTQQPPTYLPPLDPGYQQGNHQFIKEVTTQYPLYVSQDDTFAGQQQLNLFNQGIFINNKFSELLLNTNCIFYFQNVYNNVINSNIIKIIFFYNGLLIF